MATSTFNPDLAHDDGKGLGFSAPLSSTHAILSRAVAPLKDEDERCDDTERKTPLGYRRFPATNTPRSQPDSKTVSCRNLRGFLKLASAHLFNTKQRFRPSPERRYFLTSVTRFKEEDIALRESLTVISFTSKKSWLLLGYGVLAFSVWLYLNNRFNREIVSGFDIASHLNHKRQCFKNTPWNLALFVLTNSDLLIKYFLHNNLSHCAAHLAQYLDTSEYKQMRLLCLTVTAMMLALCIYALHMLHKRRPSILKNHVTKYHFFDLNDLNHTMEDKRNILVERQAYVTPFKARLLKLETSYKRGMDEVISAFKLKDNVEFNIIRIIEDYLYAAAVLDSPRDKDKPSEVMQRSIRPK